MADILSNRFLTYIMEKQIDLENDTLKVALMTSSYTPNKDTNTFVDTYEVSGTGYIAGGATLAGSTVSQEDGSDNAKWDATDVNWASSTVTARYAIIYDTTVSDVIIAVIDFGADKSSSGSDFTIEWNASGILTLAQA
jgi:hypothetical protein